MNRIKKIVKLVMSMIFLIFVIFFFEDITNLTAKIVKSTPSAIITKGNEYKTSNDFVYTKKSLDFVPFSRQDLYDIFYSILDNGYENFTFYCPKEYTDCLNDVKQISNDQIILTHLGNFVHPFNNFTSIQVITSNLGEINVLVTKMYSEEMKIYVETQIDNIINKTIDPEMNINDKILALHDYIIDNTYYDEEELEISGNAYGLLKNGKAKCSGYADIMAILLNKLKIKNYKVASENHIWNAVYINGKWHHLDLTWDDPVIKGNSYPLTYEIKHKFYMIDTNTLESYDTKEHIFDKTVYAEFKK